jgi:hypothetical protein
VRKIGEPRAGFDLRKRTIEDAFSEGFPIRAMMNDAPMDHTGRAVLLQYIDTLDSIKKKSWACHSMSARGLAHGKHLYHITSCRYSLSLGLFVSSYPLPFDTFLSIRGHFYQRPSWGAVLRPVRCPSSISLLLDMPDWGRNTRLLGWIMARRHTTPALYTTRKRLALLVVQRGLQLYTTYLQYCPAPLPLSAPLAYIQQLVRGSLACHLCIHACTHVYAHPHPVPFETAHYPTCGLIPAHRHPCPPACIVQTCR